MTVLESEQVAPEAAPPVARPRPLAPLDVRAMFAIAAAKLAFMLATTSLYGLHRDEFYYLAAGQHPAAGYVDQPPLTPLLYRGWSILFGPSQFSLHAMAAFASVPMVVMAALLARELGGDRWAQRMTMTVAAVGLVFTTSFHFLSTETVELLLTSLGAWLLVRLLRSGDLRLWVPIGAVAGLGFEDKHTILFWLAGVAAGLVLSDSRRLLASKWAVLGLVVLGTVAAPNLVWQATHHWTSLAFYTALRDRTGTQNLITYWPEQLGLMAPAGTVLVVAGVLWVRREPEGQPYRPLVIAWAGVVAAFFLTAGKGYYPAGMYIPVVAAGAVGIERAWSVRGRKRLVAAVVASGVVLAPAFTPILPASTAVSLGLTKVNPDLGGMMGWRHAVDEMAAVYRGLPAPQRASAVFLTRDYSEASALAYWRRADHLPAAISGHNSEWWWGWEPAAGARTVIAVGLPADVMQSHFASVNPAGTLHAANGQMDPDQSGLPIWVCTGQLEPWPAMWPRLRLYA